MKKFIFIILPLFLLSCYKENCWVCYQDKYTNKEAVYNSIQQNYVTGEWSYTLGESPFTLDEGHETIICDAWHVEDYERGTGQFGVEKIDTTFAGYGFEMQYNTYRIITCRLMN